MKNLWISVLLSLLLGCSAQNNITFTTVTGSCADGTVNAPYCMAVTLQNNNGGQNWITNTNFPISGLTLTVSGPSNVGYPTSQGSNYDPNNCLGSNISPGQTCTFYLQLTGESAAVGTKPAVTINANYTVNNVLFGNSGTSSTSSTTVYETPSLLISNSLGWVESYNVNGLSLAYRGESESVNNANANDNYYGFLYLAGNNGIYLSGNGTYAGNATNNSSSIKGAGNLLINGQTVYATPTGSLSTSVYNANLQQESFNWQQYANGLVSVANNVSTLSGSRVFIAQVSIASVYLCNPTSGTGNSCTPEGVNIPANPLSINASTISTLAFGNLGTLSTGVATGLVAGANNGLWVESGTLGAASNQWLPVYLSGTSQPLTNSILKISADAFLNLYVADVAGNIYRVAVSGGNFATPMTNWSAIQGQTVVAMVYDNSGSQLYIATNSGNIYGCLVAGSCTQLLSGNYPGSLFGLNIVTSLTSS